MKLKALKKYVNNLPKDLDNCEVVIQKDSEGNGYSPLSGVDEDTIYIPGSTYDGEVYDRNSTAEDNCMEEEEWEALKNDPKKRCIVLFPIN